MAHQAEALGLKYAGCAWISHKDDFDEQEAREAAKVFNNAGKILAEHGIQFFYHTHGYEFRPHGNGTLFDLLMAETDPKLVKSYKPGEVWPLTLTAAEKKTAGALADTIFPADQYGPAASEVGVVEMLDEWVSAPYPDQKNDRPLIVTGLDWAEQESAKRFKKGFAEISDAQRHAICDDICFDRKARARFKGPSRFFARFRSICAGAYYATPAGWKALGYVGNVPLEKFEGPPPEVLRILGVE